MIATLFKRLLHVSLKQSAQTKNIINTIPAVYCLFFCINKNSIGDVTAFISERAKTVLFSSYRRKKKKIDKTQGLLILSIMIIVWTKLIIHTWILLIKSIFMSYNMTD